MLEELSVRNFALIESLTLSLDRGFSVLTGETGAGKSIIVGALGFLLGSKADTEVIRSGCEEAAVSAVVSISENYKDANEWLKEREIEIEDSRVIIRRSVKLKGRSSIYIQNVPVTRSELADFMSFLFDLHGQHSHESLLKKDNHRIYLDRYCALENDVLELNRVYLALSEKNKNLDAMINSERDREGRLDLLKYAVEEIEKAKVKKGEIRELEAETQRLGDFEKLSQHVHGAASYIFDDEASLLGLAKRSRLALENAAVIDSSLLPLQKRLDDLYYETEDIASEFRDYRDSLSYDPSRLEEAEERLTLLYKLKKKYTPRDRDALNPEFSEEGILLYWDEAQTEIDTLTNYEENQDKLRADISLLEKDLISKASVLSKKRSEGAIKLGNGITEILGFLGMPKADFSVQVKPKIRESSKSLICGPWGADDIEFLISANTGEPLKDLSRIASGGELSRVMLAIKTILCGAEENTGQGTSAQTYVFDEVDTGIGGEVALSVGEYLSRIGKIKQIFCVTHLASIAVRADNHLKVEKKIIGSGIAAANGAGLSSERTITEVSLLKQSEKRLEIARMLAGDSGSAALAHADELLTKYGVD